MKRTTSRAREFVPCWSAHHGPARTRAKSQTPGRLKHIEEFPDGVLTLVLIRRSDGRAGTRLEMVFQQQRIDLLQRTLDGHGLFDDIDAVGPILDHPGHAPHVSLDAAQADGGLGPNVRGAMLEVDLGHRHTAPPPTLPPSPMGWGTSHHSITPGVSHRHPTGRRTLEGEGSGGGRKNVNGCRRVTQGSLGLTQPLTAALEKPPALYQVRDPVVFACTQRCYGPRRGGTLL